MSKAMARRAPTGIPAGKMENMMFAMRKRARNEKMALDRLVGRLIGIGSAVGGAIGAGWYVGTRMRDNKSTKVGGADIELIAGPILAVAGALIQSKTKKPLPRMLGELVEGSGVGVLAYYAGSRMEQAMSRPTATVVGLAAA